VFAETNLTTADALAHRFLKGHGDVWDLECEVRPLDGPGFGARAG
jgi:hypothetical protein